MAEVDLNKPYLEGLTYKQKLFVEYYTGNALETTRLAGYKGTDNYLGTQSYRLMQNDAIKQAIQARDKHNSQIKNNIISREEMEIELSNIVLDQSAKPETRIKAMERLAKMRGYDRETLEVMGTIEQYTDSKLHKKLIHVLDKLQISMPDNMPLLETPSDM